MDDFDKLIELRVILDSSDDDDSTLLSYLSQAKDVILNRMYPYLDERVYDELTVPKQYEYLQLRIACFLLNKRGAEGQVDHNENGIRRNFGEADIPSAMLRGILPAVGIPR